MFIRSQLNKPFDKTHNENVVKDIHFLNKEISKVLFNVEVINSKSDLPNAVGGVITLLPNKTYLITSAIDLTGDRLVTSGACNLFGYSSEVSSITSTGLGNGVPMITSEYTIVLEKITLKDVDTCISIDGNSRTVALDWENVNFENVPNIGTIDNCENFIFDTGALLGAQGLKFTGTIGTIGINNSLLRGLGSAGNIIELDASCIVTRRFRVIYSSFIATSSTVAIDVDNSATIPTESYILDTVNFAGGGTYLTGITHTSNLSLFTNCTNITNTAVNGQLYMQNNATSTTISVQNTFYKIAGNTTASSDNSKFTHADNRLTCGAIIRRKYLIQCTLSFTSGNGNICEFGFFDSQLNAVRTPSRTKATANAAGRAENVHFACVLSMGLNDYLEIHGTNTSGTTAITVDQMNFVITEIK